MQFAKVKERWRDISEEAKDLVRSLLTVKVKDRLSVQDALKHPFVRGDVYSHEVPAKRRKSN